MRVCYKPANVLIALQLLSHLQILSHYLSQGGGD